MHIKVLVDADSVAREAAAMIAAEARAAVAERGRFVAAVSGGHTPWVMLRALAGEKVPWESVHVVQVDELKAAATQYALTLQDVAGSPPVLDLVHLGLGPDGHTASLVPGDAVLEITDADVAVTEAYQERRRMTLTYPMLNRSRRVLWLVTGSEKAGMLVRLRDGDRSIPAGRVRRNRALVLADRAAADQLGTNE